MFRRSTQQSPLAFLADLRLELAQRKLSATTLPVATIAVEVGYKSESAFSRAFHRHFGMRPARPFHEPFPPLSRSVECERPLRAGLLASAAAGTLWSARLRINPLMKSDQPQSLQTRMAVLADDDVIVHRYSERSGDVDDGFGHLNIRLRWCRIAGRVVVHQKDGGGR
jgi:AraC-like DNA-binding protein